MLTATYRGAYVLLAEICEICAGMPPEDKTQVL